MNNNLNVSLRPIACPVTYGDEASRDAYIAEAFAARAAQTVKFAVAPRSTLKTKSGLKQAGDEVVVGDLSDAVNESGKVVQYASEVLWGLVRRGILLDRDA